MKNQVRPVCSPKDKIWSQTDKLQRCRRLPLEQAKLRQILENNSECVLIRKWFDRWYVAESLCCKLRCKINHVHISQQHESRRGRPIFSVRIRYPQYPPGKALQSWFTYEDSRENYFLMLFWFRSHGKTDLDSGPLADAMVESWYNLQDLKNRNYPLNGLSFWILRVFH